MQEVTANTKYFSGKVKSKIILMPHDDYEIITFITCQLLDETVGKMIKTR